MVAQKAKKFFCVSIAAKSAVAPLAMKDIKNLFRFSLIASEMHSLLK